MGAVDPKDMTASELMRYLHDRNSSCSCSMCNKVLNIVGCGEHVCADAYEALADKIDAELAEARKDAIRESKKPMWWFRNAIKCGYDWPEPRDGEKFRDYLHRCFLPRPRFEDGEVVGVSEYEDIQGYCVYDDGEFFVTTPNRSIDYAAGERVERPAPEALGADGMPIKAGETVWHVINGREATVKALKPCGVECDLHDGIDELVVWAYESITHTPPDTQQQIDEDVAKSTFEYWGCQNAPCGNCPALVGGEKPFKRFGTEDCQKAMVSDLLLRQRELDARKGCE